MTLLHGTRLGPYEVISPLGSGGMGEVWRVPAGGGAEERVAGEGGDEAFESFDGRTLYYRRGDGALVGRPTAGGAERAIVRCVDAYAVAPRVSVSPDGQSILCGRSRGTSDLMMIENLR